MSYYDDLLCETCQKGKNIKNSFASKTLFPPLVLSSYYILICLVQLELRPLVKKDMDEGE